MAPLKFKHYDWRPTIVRDSKDVRQPNPRSSMIEYAQALAALQFTTIGLQVVKELLNSLTGIKLRLFLAAAPFPFELLICYLDCHPCTTELISGIS